MTSLLKLDQVKFLVRLIETDFDILTLPLSTLIGLPLDIISKCANILSKPNEPKVSSVQLSLILTIALCQHALANTKGINEPTNRESRMEF